MALAGVRTKDQLNLPAGLGIVSDEVAQELAEGGWTSGRNVRFRDGYALKTEGFQRVLSVPVGPLYNLDSFPSGDTRWWVYSTLTDTYAHNGTTESIITGTAQTGTASNKFTSTVLGGVYALNNQADVPRYWGGTGTLTALPGWNSIWRCKALRSFKAYFIALNVTKGASNYPTLVKWSGAAEPGTVPLSWDETDPTEDANEMDLGETPDQIIDGRAMDDRFLVYKERSLFGLQFTQNSDVFRSYRIRGSYGILAQNCVANFPGGHVVLTEGPDVVVHQGGEPRSILSGRRRKWLSSVISSTYAKRAFLVENHARYEVWVCFPTGSSQVCNRALVWNYEQNTFGDIDLPNVTAGSFGPLVSSAANTWNADTEAWNADGSTWNQVDISLADRRVLMASTAPAVYLMDQGDSAAGSQIGTRLERTGMAFGDPSRLKLLRRVVPRVDAPNGTRLKIQAGGAMDAERAPTWGPIVDYVVGTSQWADFLVTGRFLALRIMSEAFGRWRIKSIGFDVRDAGGY